MRVFFYHLALVVGTTRFTFAHQLAENKRRGKQVVSCSGFCGKGMESVLVCSCDESCLYIGDCCFDFLYLCKGGNGLDASLTRQGQIMIMSSFRNKTLCIAQRVQLDMDAGRRIYAIVRFPVIAKCPSNATKSVLVLCEDYGQHKFPTLPEIPVIHQGIIYRNIYCSLCSGVNPEEVSLLEHTVINTTDVHQNSSQHFAPLITGLDRNQFNRFGLVCGSIYDMKDLQCTVEEVAEECMAYQAPIHALLTIGSWEIFNNIACAKCVNASIVKIARSVRKG